MPAPAAAASALTQYPDGLPFHYYLIGPNAVKTAGLVSRELQPGFGVAVVEEREQLARTKQGEWIPLKDLIAAKPVHFSGQSIENGRLELGWVVEARAAIWPKPDGVSKPIGARGAFERVQLEAEPAPAGWVHADGGFLRATQVRVPQLAPRPAEVAPAERWIDVDTASETLVAYEGDRPVFATLVSTGIGAAGAPLSTPRGTFHIFARLPTSKMDNLDHDTAPHYSFDEVPFVQYFNREVALHGAFWHQRFGHPVSHGCVNLAPLDAQRLFGFTKIGTIVRVR
ncbi:MAG TPA: L,D-transpeptidase [Polyangia bacterium]|nr:L,D-transpeptidase [Polyangia bacterium]